MSLINDLLKKLFDNNHQKVEPPMPPNDNYMDKWEKEREERIIAAEERLKGWVTASLKGKASLSFSWESGNDEAFVTFQDKTGADKAKFEDLENYIIDKLDIPDVGEFQMNGSGTIYIENNLAKVKYSSTIRASIDFNEETGEEIFSEEGEEDSGDKVLFAI
jgi:hypothetical protein